VVTNPWRHFEYSAFC